MFETLQGSVKHIVYQSKDTGFKVLRLKLATGPQVTVTGEFGPDMVVGAIANFHGQYRTHVKYGNNFRVNSYDLMHNAEEIDSIKLFLFTIAPNIGPERAGMIVNHFKDQIFDVLNNDPERLSEVIGIGDISATSLAEAWEANKEKWKDLRQEFTLRAFLNALGIKERRVKKILGHFGSGLTAELEIKKNPYILGELDGFGFSTADFVAKRLGFPEDSPLRLRAYMHYCLDIICPSFGHLFFTLGELCKLTDQYCLEHNTKFIGKTKFLTDDLVGILNELCADEKIIIEDEAVYSKKNFNFESRSAYLLSRVMEAESDFILLDKSAVEEHIKNYEYENGYELSEEQKQALYFFVEKKVFLITGCPGTGKTTCLKAVVELIKKMHLTLTCMTPTGISAKKLESTVGHESYTIHRRLGFKGNDWDYGEAVKYETDVAIIDETSMLDQEVFYRVLAALKERTHIVFVGDDNQLPSVSAGNVLRELINCGVIPTIRLEKIFRQEEASDIIKVAHKIKNGDTDLSLFKSDPEADVFFFRHKDITVIENLIVKLAQKFKQEKRLFQILTPRNEGPLSVSVLNKLLQEVLNPPSPDLPQIQCGDFILRKGDRIRVKKNDYENMIYNGDVGKILWIGGGKLTIEIDGRMIELSVEDLSEKIKLAYCLSVHSLQGSEYPTIILPFVNQHGKNMLQRNLLYTAITRAKKKVIVLGHGSALERAINNSSVYKRNTKLGKRVQKCLQTMRSFSSEKLPEVLQPSQDVRSNAEQYSSFMENWLQQEETDT
jgi:exodeoxyribonuclease V alpha subunit